MQRSRVVTLLVAVLIGSTVPLLVEAQPSVNQALSDAQVKKYEKWWVTNGFDVTLNKMVTDALGVSRGNDVVRGRQLTVDGKDGDPIARHVFVRLPGSAGYLFIVGTRAGPAHTFFVTRSFRLIAAVTKTPVTPAVAIRLVEAQKELNAEIVFWGKIADDN